MNEVTSNVVERFKAELLAKSLQRALLELLGNSIIAGGLWRFFTPEKVAVWNDRHLWRQAWPELSDELFFFGEDVWGNQLTLKPSSENVWLWNHENGELVDLLLAPVPLLETIIQSGIDWIDFYSPQMLAVGRAKLLDVPANCHLHWTQPQALGGPVTAANTSVVENLMHLQGHGSLWSQLSGLPPGNEIVIKPNR